MYDQANAIDEEEEKEYRLLELKYEKLYSEVYAKRKAINNGTCEIDAGLVAAFDKRMAVRSADEKYAEIEVDICDVNNIQNTTKGVSGFWLRAMLGQKSIARTIVEKDRPILQFLQDIRLELHEHDSGFTLFFEFEPNSYFSDTVLIKKYHMSSNNVIEKCEGQEIKWNPGSDPTKMKKKKKQKKGGKKTNVTVVVKCDSFFNFFETVNADDHDEHDHDHDDEDEDHEHGFGEKIDLDFELGQSFKDDLIPLALEYYLGVIEQESDEEDPYGDEQDDDDKPQPKKPAKGGPDAGAVAKGGNPANPECKQQ